MKYAKILTKIQAKVQRNKLNLELLLKLECAESAWKQLFSLICCSLIENILVGVFCVTQILKSFAECFI